MPPTVAYVTLSGGSSRATLALYAGIHPHELELLVRTAFHDSQGVCRGFQVSQETPSTFRSSRKKRQSFSTALPRLVPLSVACKAPDLLVGHVEALFTPLATSQLAPNHGHSLENLLTALENDEQLSSFEAAMLRYLCEPRQTQILAVMSGKLTVAEKKHFLLQMLHKANDSVIQPHTNGPKAKQSKKPLYADLVAKKVTVMGTKMENRAIQMQLLARAQQIRHEWNPETSKSRFLDTMELLTMTEKLVDNHMMPEEHAAHLVKLIVRENKKLWSALQSYRNDESSVLDLKATAQRLAALECEPPRPIASKKSKEKSPRKGTKQGSWLAKKSVKNALDVTAASTDVAVVTFLHAQHLLTSLELEIIMALIEQEDFQVLQTLRVYKQSDHRDVKVLRDALVSIVEEITVELGDEEKATVFAHGTSGAIRDENQWENRDENSCLLEWQRHLIVLLGRWQAQQHLTPADVSALRIMVTDRHNLLESAYEVFADDGDESELLDTLQRVAKLQRQIEQCQGGQIGLNRAPVGGLGLEDVVREMQRRGVLQGDDAAGLLVLFHGENEALQAANEAFQADGDVHELEDTLLLVVKHARFGREKEDDQPVDEVQAVCRLLADFGRSERLELWQIQLLTLLLKSHDPRLLAAFDVYYEDQKTNELVDTLKILVDLAAWERHSRSMVRDWIPSLVRSGKLPRNRAERLVQMVKARDDRVVAALVVFLSDNNKEEFVDTLVRIASLAVTVTDAKVDELKEGLALLKELEDKGVTSVEEREQDENLVCNVKPRMLAAMDVLAATHDAEKVTVSARQILAKVEDQVKDTVVGKKRELEEAKPISEDAVSSSDAEPTANKEESEETSEAKDDELDAQVSESQACGLMHRGPPGDTFAEGEAPNELAEQQEIGQSNELDHKEEQQENDVDESSEKDSVVGGFERTKSGVKEITKKLVDLKDQMKYEQTGEQAEHD